MTADDHRPTSQPSFWDERYQTNDHLFGTSPSEFVTSQAHRIPSGGSVVELAAGEGRTLFWLARERNARCTGVDFSPAALNALDGWAEEASLPVETVEADVRTWSPDRRWDAVVVVFLQLLPGERSVLYRRIRQVVRPGGVVIGQWFRPAHLNGDYDRIGPSSPDRMVPVSELRAAFAKDEVVRCTPADVNLAEGPHLRGTAAVARLVAYHSEDK